MLITTVVLREKLREYLEKSIDVTQGYETDVIYKDGIRHTVEKLETILLKYESDNSQNDKPCMILSESEQALVLYCDDELWKYIQELKNQDISKVGIQEVAKMWLKLKEILKKETKVL